jgi:hypothetical protein
VAGAALVVVIGKLLAMRAKPRAAIEITPGDSTKA